MKKAVVWIVVAAAVAGAVWLLVGPVGSSLPDPTAKSDEEIQNFLASEAFTKLDAAARQGYLDRLRELPDDRRRTIFRMEGASEEVRSRARRTLRETRREQGRTDMAAFFKMSPEEQTTHLDKRIDEMEKRRSEWRRRREEAEKSGKETPQRTERTERRGPWGRDGKMDPDRVERRMQQHLSDRTPEERSQRRQYMMRLMQRYRERFPDREMRWGREGR